MRTFPRFAGTYRTAMELDHRARRSAGSLAVVERRTLVRTPLLLLCKRGLTADLTGTRRAD